MAHWDMSNLTTVEKRLDAALEDASKNRSEQHKLAGLEWEASKTADINRVSFLDLSLELREMIYTEALICEELTCTWLPEDPAQRYVNKYNPQNQPNVALFKVCRQIRAEAQKIYYSSNTFTTRLMFAFEQAGRYAMMVPAPYKDLVRQVHYRFDFRHLLCRPKEFPIYTSMIRKWFPSAHVEIMLWEYPSSVHFLNVTSREENFQSERNFLKTLTGWDKIPDGFGITFDGVGFYSHKLKDIMVDWKPLLRAKDGAVH
ncbi:hypothetical protein BU16DRAFT_525425 [Lophium mytilinum]|uniref:Uncharacterized protein n=1 Tax=Lophium mytilinum TaxID=390894 RepID=A0A6A6QZF5_9PEZI|nr:hypothetical protein BU16DRAFT_525425 [Lophium mytilinum]